MDGAAAKDTVELLILFSSLMDYWTKSKHVSYDVAEVINWDRSHREDAAHLQSISLDHPNFALHGESSTIETSALLYDVLCICQHFLLWENRDGHLKLQWQASAGMLPCLQLW